MDIENNKAKYILILIILLLGLTSSIILSFDAPEQICGIKSTCYAVQTSNYTETLGIKNAFLGIIAFTILSLFVFMQIKDSKKYKKRIIALGLFLGTLLATYFIYLQIYEINALCKFCLIADISLILNFAIFLFWKEK